MKLSELKGKAKLVKRIETPQQASQRETLLTNDPTGLNRFSAGFAKGVLSTGLGLGTIGQTILNQTAGRVVNAVSGKGFTPTKQESKFSIFQPESQAGLKAKQFVTPQSDLEKAGFATEQFAEFFVPAIKTAKAEKAIDLFSKGVTKIGPISQATSQALTRIAGKTALAGLEAGSVRAIQTGGDVKETLSTAATAGVVRGGLATIGEGARALKLPERLYQTIFKNSKEDMLAELREGGIQKLRATKPEVFKDYVSKGLIRIGPDNVPVLNETLAEQALDKGLRGSIKNMADETVEGAIRSEDEVRRIASEYTGLVDVSEKQYTNILKQIAKDYENVGFGEIADEAKKLLDALKTGSGKVDGMTAVNIRRLLDRARLARSYDAPAQNLSMSQANLKTLADTLRGRVNKIPGMGQTMDNYSFYIDALEALAAEAKRRGNNQIIGLIDTVFLGSGVAAGATPQGAILALLARYLRSGRGTTGIAQAIRKGQAGPITSGGIGGASSGLQSLLGGQQTQPEVGTQSQQSYGNSTTGGKRLSSLGNTKVKLVSSPSNEGTGRTGQGSASLQQPQQSLQSELSSPEYITKDELIKQTYAQMPKFDPTGAMGVGGMAARAGAKVAAPILKEAAEVAEQMTIRTYRLAKSYLAGAKPATEMEALNEVAKLEPGLLKASIEDIKNYFKAVVKAYEDSIGN